MKDRLLGEWNQGSRAHIPQLFALLATQAPEEFAVAAMALIDTKPDANLQRLLVTALLEDRSFITYLTTPSRFSRDEMVAFGREFQEADPRFDTKLAQLLPQRYDDRAKLDSRTILAVLDILGEISVGPRLVLLVKHLAEHADERIASKAFYVLGSRLQNRHWLKRSLESAKPRARANLVESLWGDCTPSARQVFDLALADSDNRVVGNALVGLRRAGEPTEQLTLKMLEDARPEFRWTAAWVLAETHDTQHIETLRRKLEDPDPNVRRVVERSMRFLEDLLQKPALPAEVRQTQPDAETVQESAIPTVAADPELALRLDASLHDAASNLTAR